MVVQVPSTPTIRYQLCADEVAEPQGPAGLITATVPEQFERAQLLGFNSVGMRFVWSDPPDPNSPRPKRNIMDCSPDERHAWAADLRRRGIAPEVILSRVGKSWITPAGGPKHAEYKTAEAAKREIDLAIAAGQDFGCRVVRIFGGYAPIAAFSPADWSAHIKQAGKLMQIICGALAKAGMMALLENEKYLAAHSLPTCVEMIDTHALGNVLIAYDPGNAQHIGLNAEQIAGQLQTVIDRGLLGTVHLKECVRVPATVGSVEFDEAALAPFHCVAGTGDAGVRRSFQQIYDGWDRMKPALTMLAEHGISGLPAMVEGHLNAGGHYGGSSGVDGVRQISDSMQAIWRDIGFAIA